MPLFTFHCWILSPFYRQQIDILFNGHFKPLFDRAIPIVAIAGCIWNLRSTLPSYKYVVTVVMWTAVLTIGTPLGHGTTSPSTAAAAHSASDYICYCSAHWPVAPRLVHRHWTQVLFVRIMSIIHLAKQNGIQLFMIINKWLKELQLKGGQG